MIGKTNIGSGGGLTLNKPLIHVNTLVGSTVDFTFDGVIVKSLPPTKAFLNADGETADYYYSIQSTNYGIWTITATLNGHEISEDITINTIEQYNIELFFRYYIIKNGIIPSGVTIDTGLRTNWNVTLTENYNNQGYARMVTAGTYSGGFVSQAIDLTQYNTANVDFALQTSYGSFDFAIYPGNRYSDQNAARRAALVQEQTTATPIKKIVTLDLSSISGNNYPGCFRGTADSQNQTALIYNMWLEYRP